MLIKRIDLRGFRSIEVSHLMTPRPFAIDLDFQIKDLSQLLRWRHIRNVPVVGAKNQLLGLLTYRATLKWASKASGKNPCFVREIMEEGTSKETESCSLEKAVQILDQNDSGCLLIVRNEELMGILTEADIVHFINSQFPPKK